MSRSRDYIGEVPVETAERITAKYRVKDTCPNCRKGILRRGVKKNDKIQVYCPLCGFTAPRKEV